MNEDTFNKLVMTFVLINLILLIATVAIKGLDDEPRVIHIILNED